MASAAGCVDDDGDSEAGGRLLFRFLPLLFGSIGGGCDSRRVEEDMRFDCDVVAVGSIDSSVVALVAVAGEAPFWTWSLEIATPTSAAVMVVSAGCEQGNRRDEP